MTQPLPDYSEFLKQPGMLAWVEQEWKRDPSIHDYHARVVNEVIEKYNITEVVEMGCGTGNIAKRIPDSIIYTGYDFNEQCIELAKKKNNITKAFFVGDIRDGSNVSWQLVLSFGFLKHFGLHEWSTIFNKVASFGKYFIFDMPISAETHDDGVEHHHVWKSLDDLEKDIVDADLVIINIDYTNPVEPVFVCKRK